LYRQGNDGETKLEKVKNMAKKTVANLLVDTLVAAGAKRVYGLAGDSLNGITGSIRRVPGR
jgi:pyruvate dehydrogenase (quinone)